MTPRKINKPSIANPALYVPVQSKKNPTSDGPTKPPRLPMELIRAIPPAAPVPLRNEAVKAQKGPSAPQMPIAVMAIQATSTLREPADAERIKPTDAKIIDPAICNLRSPVRSDDEPTISMKTAVAKYGRIETTPIMKLLKLDTLFKIDGIQMEIPYIATIMEK